MLVPSLLWVSIFCYWPMYGVIMAFQNFKPALGFTRSPWVGFENFRELFGSPVFLRVMRNTFSISVMRLVLGFPVPIVLALLITEIRNTSYRRIIQTLTYVPYFVSWVVVSAICFLYFAPVNGVINQALRNIGLIENSLGFLEIGFRFVVMLVLANIWKTAGWSAIIYFAAIAGVDAELFEAAQIDGVRGLQKVIYITLPCIMPTIIIMLILNIANIINAGFEQQMIMANTMVWEWAEVIDTYAYRYGLRALRFSYGTAIGFFKSVVACVLLWGSNAIVRRTTGYHLYN